MQQPVQLGAAVRECRGAGLRDGGSRWSRRGRSAHHFPEVRHDLIQHCAEIGHRLVGGAFFGRPTLDQRFDLAALANQPVELGGDLGRGLGVGAGLVEDVDGLVRTRAVRHKPIGEDDGRLERVVRDRDRVMPLEPRPPRHQHLPRLDRIELLDRHGLKAALQRRILADPLVVLFPGGGADHAHVATHERRLQHVRRVHRDAHRGPLPDQVVQLVHEEDQIGIGG